MSKTKLLLLTLGVLGLFVIGCDREITGDVAVQTNASENCFDCHDGTNDLGPEVVLATRQWENSMHGSGNAMRSSGSCARCHTTEGYVEEITGEDNTSGVYNAVGCFACHDPHENGDFEIRAIAAVTLENGATYDQGVSNNCAYCHQSRRDVETYVVAGKEMSNHFGPHHSNQADMMLGENAYEYDGYDYENSWHATGMTNGCVTCHFDASDAYNMGGHTFEMATADDENTDACNIDGCHVNDLEIDDFDREMAMMDFDNDADSTEGVQTEVGDLMDELRAALVAAGLLEYIAEDDAWEPTDDLVVPNADTLGAVYNWAFVHEDQSHGIHNTLYAVALLQSSINYMATGDPDGVSGNPGDTRTVAMTSKTLSSH
jgi:hypothetical protein